MYDSATEAICAALDLIDGQDQYVPLAKVLSSKIKELVPIYEASVETEDIARLVPL